MHLANYLLMQSQNDRATSFALNVSLSDTRIYERRRFSPSVVLYRAAFINFSSSLSFVSPARRRYSNKTPHLFFLVTKCDFLKSSARETRASGVQWGRASVKGRIPNERGRILNIPAGILYNPCILMTRINMALGF